jgi:nitroreductase
MDYEALKQLIQERRSVRKFTDRPVAEEDIIELID